MYSVYFSSESAGDRACNLRSSCLRSSNRSFRKSFPSQVNKSNAKKHGGFPRRNIRFLNCGLPCLETGLASSRCSHLVSFCFIFASIANRELRVLLDRVSGPLREDQSANWRWFMRRQQLMEPDFLSELLLLIIGAVMSFFLIWTGVIALLRR